MYTYLYIIPYSAYTFETSIYSTLSIYLTLCIHLALSVIPPPPLIYVFHSSIYSILFIYTLLPSPSIPYLFPLAPCIYPSCLSTPSSLSIYPTHSIYFILPICSTILVYSDPYVYELVRYIYGTPPSVYPLNLLHQSIYSIFKAPASPSIYYSTSPPSITSFIYSSPSISPLFT
jgi:hypothetical protein